MTIYPAGSPAFCNACNKPFSLPKACKGYETYGKERAARLTDFCTCPVCGRMDTHWVNVHVIPRQSPMEAKYDMFQGHDEPDFQEYHDPEQ